MGDKVYLNDPMTLYSCMTIAGTEIDKSTLNVRLYIYMLPESASICLALSE